jgi:hypothetical protein
VKRAINGEVDREKKPLAKENRALREELAKAVRTEIRVLVRSSLGCTFDTDRFQAALSDPVSDLPLAEAVPVPAPEIKKLGERLKVEQAKVFSCSSFLSLTLSFAVSATGRAGVEAEAGEGGGIEYSVLWPSFVSCGGDCLAGPRAHFAADGFARRGREEQRRGLHTEKKKKKKIYPSMGRECSDGSLVVAGRGDAPQGGVREAVGGEGRGAEGGRNGRPETRSPLGGKVDAGTVLSVCVDVCMRVKAPTVLARSYLQESRVRELETELQTVKEQSESLKNAKAELVHFLLRQNYPAIYLRHLLYRDILLVCLFVQILTQQQEEKNQTFVETIAAISEKRVRTQFHVSLCIDCSLGRRYSSKPICSWKWTPRKKYYLLLTVSLMLFSFVGGLRVGHY